MGDRWRGGSGRLRGGCLSGQRGWRGRCPARGRMVVSKAPVQRPRPAGLWQNARHFETGSACRPVARRREGHNAPGALRSVPGSRRYVSPGPQARRSIPSEAAVATRTPSGASARTIGRLGIKCQERIAEGVSHRCWRTGPHPAFGHLLPQAGEGSYTSDPSPVRSMGEGARRAGEGPSDSEGGGHRCWRTGPHPARRATFSRRREKGPVQVIRGRSS